MIVSHGSPSLSHASHDAPPPLRYAPPMALKRYGVVEGPQDEILAELDEYGAGAARYNEEKAREYARAINAIKSGAEAVRVKETLYRVIED